MAELLKGSIGVQPESGDGSPKTPEKKTRQEKKLEKKRKKEIDSVPDAEFYDFLESCFWGITAHVIRPIKSKLELREGEKVEDKTLVYIKNKLPYTLCAKLEFTLKPYGEVVEHTVTIDENEMMERKGLEGSSLEMSLRDVVLNMNDALFYKVKEAMPEIQDKISSALEAERLATTAS